MKINSGQLAFSEPDDLAYSFLHLGNRMIGCCTVFDLMVQIS